MSVRFADKIDGVKQKRTRPLRESRRGHLSVMAAAVAIVVIVTSGFGYRAYFRSLKRTTDRIVFPRETLNQNFPVEFDGWVGRDLPLDEQIFKTADIDDYLQRGYQRGTDSVTLYIAAGVRARDLVPHRPDVCYPASGWTRRSREELVLDLPDGSKLPASLYEFTPAKLTGHNIRVLNYYFVDGAAAGDVELLRSKARQGISALRYMAQVQLTTSVREGEIPGHSVSVMREFAQATALPIREICERESARQGSANAGSQEDR